MIADFESATEEWPAGTAHVERFVPPPLAPDPEARPFTLVLARHRRAAAARIRALGAEVDASCEGGICGACHLRWLECPPLRRDRVLSPVQRQRDVTVCVAGCAGPRLVPDL
jgi:vanillate O-demethylase ferredoxin subunit